MGKYRGLTEFLKGISTSEVPMSFEEVAGAIGSALPPSAYKHRPWWANESAGHIHAKAWLAAGFEATQVDMEGRKLVFKRIAFAPKSETAAQPRGMAEEPRVFEGAPEAKGERRRHPLIGCMKGLLWIEPGYDLTKPALDEDWEEAFDKKWDALLK